MSRSDTEMQSALRWRLLEPFEEQDDTVDAPQELLPDPELHSLHRMELGHIKTRELPTLRIALLGNPQLREDLPLQPSQWCPRACGELQRCNYRG